MTVNGHLTDLQIRHAIDLLKHGNGVEAKVLKLLRDLEAQYTEKLAGRLAMIQSRGTDRGPATTARVTAALDDVRGLITNVYSKTHDELATSLGGLAEAEAKFQARALKGAFTVDINAKVPSPARLRKIVTEQPLHGKLLRSWTDGMAEGTLGRVEEAVRNGMASGEGVEKIVSRLTGAGSEFEKSKDWARSVVRTTITAVSNEAQQATWAENSDIIKGWQFVATLDSRTTLTCAAQDGKIYDLGTGPVPPLHIRCRSTTVAVTKSWKEMGLNRADLTEGQRASMDGQVAGPINFEEWLKGKSEEFQNEYFGPARADLWRSGKVTLNDLVRGTGGVKSLEELGAVATAPVRKAFTSPINTAVTDASIAVEARLAVQKRLTAKFTQAAADPRYDARHEFKGRSEKDWGKANFNTTFTDQATSMLGALHPEVDAIADAFAIPRLRGFKAMKSAVGDMGDGVMGLSADYFNGYARRLAGAVDNTANATARMEAIKADIQKLAGELDDVRAKRRQIIAAHGGRPPFGNADYQALVDREAELINDYHGLRGTYEKAWKAAQSGRVVGDKPPSTWKPGDDVLNRPFGTSDYFSGIDQARSVLFHEMAHHVHQMWRKEGRRSGGYLPPLERELSSMFAAKFRGANGAANAARQASKYALTNSKEWFAENFSLYMMGRKDLMDQDILQLIERLLNEVG